MALGDKAMTLLFWIGSWLVGMAGGLILFEQALGLMLRRSADWLPDELCGPEGWLVDTTRRAGVFDRAARS